ncbi:hypothetical protein BHM03_00061050 [Ensete ventricosum]|nr:hypothetical protein BHM03_00061050 [Ensete ventricosum]
MPLVEEQLQSSKLHSPIAPLDVAQKMAALSVADICWKMAAKRSELEGSSDDRGRRGQQQRRLRLWCDFVAAGGVGCNKGATAIGGRQGSDVHGYCGGGMELQRKIAVGSFLPQGSLLAAIKEDDSKRSLLAALGSERCMLQLKG